MQIHYTNGKYVIWHQGQDLRSLSCGDIIYAKLFWVYNIILWKVSAISFRLPQSWGKLSSKHSSLASTKWDLPLRADVSGRAPLEAECTSDCFNDYAEFFCSFPGPIYWLGLHVLLYASASSLWLRHLSIAFSCFCTFGFAWLPCLQGLPATVA